MATLQAESTIGGYQLIRLLGEGGMGEVWLGQDMRAERRVALKFIKPHLLDDPGFRTRFTNEAKTLGKLEHDRIVTLYAVLDEGDHLALVLRFIDGNSLSDRVDAHGALPLSFVLSCSRDILPALGFAHESGIIHRDIKPPNILVDSRDRSFLMDFGIAVAAFAERGTMTGFAIGTPHYMSPEQIRTPRDITPDKGGHRTDIYSFGVVLFEMLSGRVPFGQHSGVEDMYAIQHAHCNEAPPSLCEINPAVSPAVESVVLSCLAKDPADRPQTCIELLARLESASLSHATAPQPARPAQHSRTVLEPRAVPAAKPASAPVAQPAAAAAAVAAPLPVRRKMPQQVWYGLGALFIAGGVGWTVMTSQHNTTTKTSPIVQSPAAAISDTELSTQKTPRLPGSATQGGKTRQGTTNVNIYDQRQTALPPQQAQQGPTPEQIAAAQRAGQAEKEFRAGKTLFEQGEYCESKAKLDDAMSLNPKPEYAKLQRSAINGCNSQ